MRLAEPSYLGVSLLSMDKSKENMDSDFTRLSSVLPNISQPKQQNSDSQSPRRRKSESEEPVAGEVRPLIPEEDYNGVCYKTSKGKSWGGKYAIFVNFRVVGGLYDGTDLFMACQFYSPFKERHKYYEQWAIAAGRRPHSGERLARKVFLGRLYRIRVRNSKRVFSDNTPKPETLQYSVVDRIIEPLTGGFPE